MLGSTPPWAMVTPANSLFNSSSFLMASWGWRGLILCFLLSRAAFPGSQQLGTPWVQQVRLERLHQLAQHSCHFAAFGGPFQQGIAVQHGWNVSWPSHGPFLLFLFGTLSFLSLLNLKRVFFLLFSYFTNFWPLKLLIFFYLFTLLQCIYGW